MYIHGQLYQTLRVIGNYMLIVDLANQNVVCKLCTSRWFCKL